MLYIQSFYQYPVTFSSIGKGVPAVNADGDYRNIAEITEEEFEKLQNKEPMFRELVNNKKYRVLKKLPDSYKPAATLVNEARAEADRLKAELEAIKAGKSDNGTSIESSTTEGNPVVDIDKMDYKDLQALAKEKGIENVNIKKAELIEAIKAAQ